MHRKLRGADIDGGDPGPGRGQWADRRPARQVGAVLVPLQRDPGLPAGQLERRRGASVGGISQIRVHLEHRPGIDLDRVAGLVPLRVVGVGGMGHVGPRPATTPAARRGSPPCCRRRPARSVPARCPAGWTARRGRRTNRPPRGRRAPTPAGSPAVPGNILGQQCLHTRIAAGLVVQPWCARRFCVTPITVDGVRSCVIKSAAGATRAPAPRPARRRSPRTNPVVPQRPQTALTCRCGSSVTDLRSSARWIAELRHPQDRIVYPDQPVADPAAVPHRQPPTDTQVSVPATSSATLRRTAPAPPPANRRPVGRDAA